MLLLLGTVLLLGVIMVRQYLALPGPMGWPLAMLQLALGLAYVLFVPGYCLSAALFPGTDDMGGIDRAGLSLGLSVAWVSVLALILDALPEGLRLWPIMLGELASIALFAAVGLWRGSRLPVGPGVPPPAWRPRPWWRSLPGTDRLVYGFVAMALLVTAVAAGWVFLVPSADQFVTEFYVLGPQGLAEGYPREVAVGEELSVTLGVVNRERAARTYRVEVWAVDPWTEGRRALAAEVGPFTLDVGQGNEWPIAWQMPWAGDDQVVELQLFDGAGSEPYRSLRLWLNVRE